MLRNGIDAFIALRPQNYRQTLISFSPPGDQRGVQKAADIQRGFGRLAIAEIADDFEKRRLHLPAVSLAS